MLLNQQEKISTNLIPLNQQESLTQSFCLSCESSEEHKASENIKLINFSRRLVSSLRVREIKVIDCR